MSPRWQWCWGIQWRQRSEVLQRDRDGWIYLIVLCAVLRQTNTSILLRRRRRCRTEQTSSAQDGHEYREQATPHWSESVTAAQLFKKKSKQQFESSSVKSTCRICPFFQPFFLLFEAWAFGLRVAGIKSSYPTMKVGQWLCLLPYRPWFV